MQLAYSHVHLLGGAKAIQFPLNPLPQVFVDDAAMLVAVYVNDVFYVHSLRHMGARPKVINFVLSGPVRSVKFSPDHRFMCIQRTLYEIEVINLRETTEFRVSCKTPSPGNEIVGMVWVSNEMADICLICASQLEFLKFTPKQDGMKQVKQIKQANNWFLYSQPTRLLVCCCGKEGNVLQSYQFPPNNIVKMPKIMPEVAPKGGAGLQPSEFVLSKLYDKLCLLFTHSARQELVVYQLGRDEVARYAVINLYTAADRFAVSVLDNLLVVHNMHSHISMIFDLHSSKQKPVAAPLPLGLPEEAAPDGALGGGEVDMSGWEFIPPRFVMDKKSGYIWEVSLSLEHLSVSCSDKPALLELLLKRTGSASHILRVIRGAVVDQEPVNVIARLFNIINAAFAQSLKKVVEEAGAKKSTKWWFFEDDTPHIVGFLDALEGGRTAKQSKYSKGVNAAAARAADADAASAGQGMGDFGGSSVYAQKITMSTADKADGLAQDVVLVSEKDSDDGLSSKSLVDQSHILAHVLTHASTLVANDHLPADYVIAVTTEYLRSLHKHALPVEPFLFEFLISLLVGVNPPRFVILHQCLQYHVIQDSKMVARQLLAVADQYPPAMQLALDMLHRLGAKEDIVEVLVNRGRLIVAINYIRSNKVPITQPAMLLKAAVDSGDDALFFTVFRFLESRNEGLRGSPAFLPDEYCDEYVNTFREKFPQALKHREIFSL